MNRLRGLLVMVAATALGACSVVPQPAPQDVYRLPPSVLGAGGSVLSVMILSVLWGMGLPLEVAAALAILVAMLGLGVALLLDYVLSKKT